MSNANCDQLTREGFVQDTPNARVDQFVREAWVSLQTSNAACDQVMREVFCQESPHAQVNQLVREVFMPVTLQSGPSMPIIYPLNIPSLIGESKAELTKFDAIGEFISEFVGTAEQQQWSDQHWELGLEWPEMNWPQFAAFDAFIGALHGKLGSFLWGPPLATAPRGSGSGTPVLGTNASGASQLLTTGWAASASDLLLPGDFFQLGPYALAIVSVQVVAGALSVVVVPTLTAGQEAFLQSVPLFFQGLTAATWLNGSSLRILGFSAGPGGNTTINFLTVPPGMPNSYTSTADTGSALAGPPRLHQYVDAIPLASDGSGNATLDIFPSVREPLPSGSPITLVNPQGTFRLADNRRTASADQKKVIMLKLKCREAI